MITRSESDSPRIAPRKSVRFSSVVIREYPMILGDHPEVSGGPPVTIDWCHNLERCLSVEEYDQLTNSKPRHYSNELRMSESSRSLIILNAGYEYFEMNKAIEEAARIKANRGKTLQSQNMLGPKEFSKSAILRRAKKVFSRFKQEIKQEVSFKSISYTAKGA